MFSCICGSFAYTKYHCLESLELDILEAINILKQIITQLEKRVPTVSSFT